MHAHDPRAPASPSTDWGQEPSAQDLRDRLAKAGVPARALTAALAGADETEAVATVRAFLTREDSFLILSGVPGSGKTTAAAVAINELPPRIVGEALGWEGSTVKVKQPRTARFIAAAEIATVSSFQEETFWNAVQRADLLVIDDTGRELLDKGGWALGRLVNLLCHRHDDGRRTLITTNLDSAAWVRRYCERDGGRLLDRLQEQEHRGGRPAFHGVRNGSLRKHRPMRDQNNDKEDS